MDSIYGFNLNSFKLSIGSTEINLKSPLLTELSAQTSQLKFIWTFLFIEVHL